ncbi:transmembrane protein 120B isoform X3 [Trachypithecus francoisi]|uniref:transmembrane protein 120B isoform X3 n=1 Tax=Trachypithecus francoisi TaxID=54180 RepID=UPI00141B4266|nr:transmembrane protein 120B isoform X3 [Trachypithecus francoisi]
MTFVARVAPAAQEQLVPPRAAGERAGVGRWGASRAALREQPPPPPCTIMSGQLERCEREWHELEGEFQELQETHRIYKQKLEELAALQTLCSSSISKQKKHLKDLKLTLQRCKRHTSQEEAELVQQMAANIKERQDVFFDMEAYLPKKNGLYLNLVLGNVNVTLLSNQAKFAYKDEYEKFKLYLTIILLLGAVACRFVLHYRVTDEVFNFLLVWYYCTLTIRESILISNGSRIKGWWVSHHYVSTFLSGVMLTWPNGPIYQKFRNQFLAFSIFQSCVQFLQYYYQRGCLYRLRALGERNHLDLTVEGFQSWMWRGLTFLLPFLFCGHVSSSGVCGYRLSGLTPRNRRSSGLALFLHPSPCWAPWHPGAWAASEPRDAKAGARSGPALPWPRVPAHFGGCLTVLWVVDTQSWVWGLGISLAFYVAGQGSLVGEQRLPSSL